MDSKLPKRKVHTSHNKTAKSLYKPYWSIELDLKWLRCNGSCAEKRRLRALYVTERRHFEKLNKKAKKQYQMAEQYRLLDLKNGHNTREFWREIGKL